MVLICPLTVPFNPPTGVKFPSMGVEFPLTVSTFPADRIWNPLKGFLVRQ
jgi:hypothetical protein